MKSNRSKLGIVSTVVIMSTLTLAVAVSVEYGTRGEINSLSDGSGRELIAYPEVSHEGENMLTGKHELSAEAKKSVFTPDEPILLEVTLSNKSAEAIYIIETSPLKDNRLEITKSRGEKVPLSEKGRKIMQSGEVRRMVSKIGPGEKLEYEIGVGELYDLSDSGTYTVVVKRTILLHDKKKFTEVKSNPVKVLVGPKD